MRTFRRACKLFLFLALIVATQPLRAQEAPGEDVPGIDSERARPFTETAPPQKAPVDKDLTADEKAQLEKLFEEKAAEPAPAASPSRPTGDGEEKPLPHVNAEEGEVVIPAQTMHKEEAAPAAVPEQPAANTPKGPDIYMDMSRVAVFRVLNKQTTRSRTLEVPENNRASQGSLEIALTECWRSPPDAQPASAALVRIWEEKTAGNTKKTELFYGWLFSANPSLNDLEHPVYDVTLVECK